MSKIPSPLVEELEAFLEKKRAYLQTEISQFESSSNYIHPSTVSMYKSELQFTFEFIKLIENCRDFIKNAKVRSGKPKLSRKGFIEVGPMFINPNISVYHQDTLVRVSSILGDKHNLRSLLNSSRYEPRSILKDSKFVLEIEEVVPGMLLHLIYYYENTHIARHWDDESGGLVRRSIFHSLEDEYNRLEDEILKTLQSQIEYCNELISSERSNPNGKIRKNFRKKLTAFLCSEIMDFDDLSVSAEELETILKLDPDFLERITTWIRRNHLDIGFVGQNDIRISIDQANVKSVLKS